MSVDLPQSLQPPLPSIIMVSLHTSPLAQPGSGDAGGLNVYVRHLAQCLAHAGHPVWILTRQDSPGQRPEPLAHPENLPDGGPVAWVLPVPAGPASPVDKDDLLPWVEEFAEASLTALSTARALEGDRAVVVHSHYWLSGLAGELIAQHLRARLVHTMHTLAAVKHARDPEAREAPEREQAESQLARSADCLVANTPAERADLVELAGAEPDRVVVVPPGVDTEVFTPQGPAAWPGATAPLRLFFAGRIQSHKGPQVAVAALGLLRETLREDSRSAGGPPLALHLTGAPSGTEQLDLMDLAREAGVEDWVTVSAPMAPAELASAFRAADAVLMPSHSESFGLVALEAQACGTPVLAHRVGGLVHAVEDGVTGRLVRDLDPVSWAASLRAILDAPDDWTALGPAAARRAQQFGWEEMARAMSGIYRSITERGPRAPQ